LGGRRGSEEGGERREFYSNKAIAPATRRKAERARVDADEVEVEVERPVLVALAVTPVEVTWPVVEEEEAEVVPAVVEEEVVVVMAVPPSLPVNW